MAVLRSELTVVTVFDFSEPSALVPVTVSVLLPFEPRTVTSVTVRSKLPSPVDVLLGRLRQSIGAGRDDRLVAQRVVRVEVGDRLGLAAVRIEQRDVGLGLVEAAGTRRILLGGRRQPARAGRNDQLVPERAVSIEIRDRAGPAAVRIQHVRRGLIHDAIAVDVPRDRNRVAVRAGGRRDPVSQRPVAVEVADRRGAAAVGVEHRDVGPGLLEAAGAIGIALCRDRQAVGARRRDGASLQ